MLGIFTTHLGWSLEDKAFEPVKHPLQDQRLIAIQKALASHPIVRGNFQQDLKIPGLKPGKKTTGHFVFSQGKGIIWQVQQPKPLTLTITAQGVRQLQDDHSLKPLDRSSKTFSPAFSEGFLTLFRGDFGALEKRFDFSLQSQNTRWQLALEPQSKSVRKNLARMVLMGSDHLDGIHLFSAHHAETQISFSEVDLSQTPLTAEEALLLDS